MLAPQRRWLPMAGAQAYPPYVIASLYMASPCNFASLYAALL